MWEKQKGKLRERERQKADGQFIFHSFLMITIARAIIIHGPHQLVVSREEDG